jgi:type I restriction enzyme S subunit
VAKVDELMALCDQLESQQKQRETKKATLVQAALTRFTDAPTPVNLEFLFHKSYAIEPAELRKTILTLAVTGRIVTQDYTDESAHDMLLRMSLSNGVDDGVRNKFLDVDLPQNWTKILFEEVAQIASGVTLGRKLGDRRTVTLPYLRVANVKRGEIDISDVKTVAIGEDEIERFALRAGDLLMIEGGDWDKVGRAAIWRGEIPNCLHQNHVFRVRMRTSELLPVWFECYINSPIGRRYFENAAKQTTNLASINMRQVRACPILLPPLAEQKRIVAKVDELMALVDKLEAQLAASRDAGAKLIEAVVAAIAGPEGSGPGESVLEPVAAFDRRHRASPGARCGHLPDPARRRGSRKARGGSGTAATVLAVTAVHRAPARQGLS